MTTYAGRPVFAPYFTDPSGNPQELVSITVYNRGTVVKPTLYTSRTKATPLANPFTADSLGNANFYVDPGEYDALVNGLTVPFSSVPDPVEPLDDAAVLAAIPSGTYVEEVSPEQFGALAGAADNHTAIQAAVDYIVANGGCLRFDRDYSYAGALVIPEAASLFRVRGDSIGRTLTQLTDNTPHFSLPETGTHDWKIDTLTLSWANQQVFATHPNSMGFSFGNAGTEPDLNGHYNFKIKDIRFGKGCIGIGTAATSGVNPLWGWKIDGLHFLSTWAGPYIRIINDGGSPNCQLGQVYGRADGVPTSVPYLLGFKGIHGMTVGNVEVNNSSLPVEMFFESCLAVTLFQARTENGTMSSLAAGLITVSGSDVTILNYEVQTKVIAVGIGNYAYAVGSFSSNIVIGTIRIYSLGVTSGTVAAVQGAASSITVIGALAGFDVANTIGVYPWDTTPANVVQMAGGKVKTGHSLTADRPSAVTAGKGAQFYDDDLAMPIWSNGATWRKADGTAA